MKKRTFLILILLIAGLNGRIFAQRDQTEITLQKLSERLSLVQGGRGANGGVYIGDNGVLVIDTKMTREAVEQTLSAIGAITDLPLQYLVNTHSDGDHVNGNQFFPESVSIIAHENCRKEFFHPARDGSPSQWLKPEMSPFIPSVTFKEKLTLYLGNSRLELWYFGIGHTTGDAVVYFPDERIAFIGDMIFANRPQLIHAYKGGSSFDYVETQKKMLNTLDARLYCSGHADPVTRETVRSHIENMEQMQTRIAELIKQNQTLDIIRSAFEENASRLVEVIYNEIKAAE